jgi:hypothetical protein
LAVLSARPPLPSVFDGANQLCEALTIGEALPLAPFDEAIYVGNGSADVDLVCRLFNRLPPTPADSHFTTRKTKPIGGSVNVMWASIAP